MKENHLHERKDIIMPENVKTLLLVTDQKEYIDLLSIEQKAELLDAIYAFGMGEEPQFKDKLTQMAFMFPHHEPYVNGGFKDAHGNYRRFPGRKERDQKKRSRTFEGIGKAMAEQWSRYVLAEMS